MPDVIEPPAAPAKVSAKYPPQSARDWDLARGLHRTGLTWSQISEQTGIPAITIRVRAKREGWLRVSDATIIIKTEPRPLVIPSIQPGSNGQKSDQLRQAALDDSLISWERVKGRIPRTLDEERKRTEITRSLTAQSAQAGGWSEQDRLIGGVLAGQVERFVDAIEAPPKRETTPLEPGPTVDIESKPAQSV